MSQEIDDLEAVRILVTTLEKFQKEEQERIVRWAREKLGLEISHTNPTSNPTTQHLITPVVTQQLSQSATTDLKNFVISKKPTSDMQFASIVAYYYRFEAPEKDRKDSIDSKILQDATRLASRERLKDPGQTLRNASNNGLLNKAEEKGFYRINTVGENLVAMTLPQNNTPLKKTRPKTNKIDSKVEKGKK